MSSFGDILSSIGGKRAPSPPPKAQRPSQAPTAGLERPGSSSNASKPAANGIKRKPEDEIRRDRERPFMSTHARSSQNLAQNGDKIRSGSTDKPTAATLPSTKAPSKGSFADILARAKASQQQRGLNQVGMIKHQPGLKDKASKLAERQKKPDNGQKTSSMRAASQVARNGNVGTSEGVRQIKPQPSLKTGDDPSGSPALSKPKSTYKGTMGRSGRKTKHGSPLNAVPRSQSRRHQSARYDDYLGTDEEEDSDVADDDDTGGNSGYDSEGSSDMEAGVSDLEAEETRALKAAKADDAKELALEQKLKREKEERKRRLQAMVNKGR